MLHFNKKYSRVGGHNMLSNEHVILIRNIEGLGGKQKKEEAVILKEKRMNY